MTRFRQLIIGLTMPTALAILVVVPAFAFAPIAPDWLPTSIRNWAFDIRLALAPMALKASSIRAGKLSHDRFYIDDFGESIQLRSGSLTIVGTLYRPITDGQHPAVLLTHGSTPSGRNLGLYRLLGKELSERGYLVLSIDLRGFGDSDDPEQFLSAADLDYVADSRSSLDYLQSLTGVDPERMYLIGHSFGGSVAIATALEDPRITKLVAIGPARRMAERMGNPDAAEFPYYKRRIQRYMRVKDPIPDSILLQNLRELPLERHLEELAAEGGPPILLIDGAAESSEDRDFLREIFDEISTPKKYVTLLDADHYANVASFGSLIFYDRSVTSTLVNEIDLWLCCEN